MAKCVKIAVILIVRRHLDVLVYTRFIFTFVYVALFAS